MSPQYKAGTCGLCGNYDHNQGNDFISNDQIVESSLLEFTRSWRSDLSCNESLPTRNPCEVYIQRADEARARCDVLRRAPFGVCHDVVDPEDGYVQQCEHDVCACQDAVGCYCTALAKYASDCARRGVVVNWRNAGVVPSCGMLIAVSLFIDQGWVVQRPISANPGLKVNLLFCFHIFLGTVSFKLHKIKH